MPNSFQVPSLCRHLEMPSGSYFGLERPGPIKINGEISKNPDWWVCTDFKNVLCESLFKSEMKKQKVWRQSEKNTKQ